MFSPRLATTVPDIDEAVLDIAGGVLPCVFHKRGGYKKEVIGDGCLNVCVSPISVSYLLL